jgi:YHS domain-containing protein
MVSILLRLLILILGLWLLRRILGKIFNPAGQQGSGKNTPAAPNNMVKDPICGMYMDSRLAVRLEDRKELVYFCSEECKGKYLDGTSGNNGI